MLLGGLILAGGRSRRMGRPKESLPLGDTTMLAHQCRTLLGCCDDVVVVGRDREQPLPTLPPGVATAFDDTPDQGPLAALAAGLRHLRDVAGYADDDAAMTTGCDQPYLDATTVRWLLARLGTADLLMPRALGRLQPLTAIYRVGMLPIAADLLARGRRRPRELAAAVEHAAIAGEAELREHDPELRCLRNLNHIADYEAARRALEPTDPATDVGPTGSDLHR